MIGLAIGIVALAVAAIALNADEKDMATWRSKMAKEWKQAQEGQPTWKDLL